MYDHERSLVEKHSTRPFALLGVNTDGKISTVQDAIEENNLNWRSWYDGRGGPIVEEYEIRGFPTIFLIDHNGIIRYKNLRGRRLDLALETLIAAAEADGMRGGATPGPKLREFVDLSGRHKTLAAYLGYEKGKVILRKDSEEEVKVPWNKISIADRQYVAAMRLKEAGMKKAAMDADKLDFGNPFDFTSTSGSRSVPATFIALNQGDAVLWRTDGREIKVPWRKLTDESKDYINGEIKKRK